MRNLYRILGTRKNVKPETLKRAFRRTAKQTHPDHGGDAEDFREVKEAWRILGNEKWRQYYDETGEIHPGASTIPETQEKEGSEAKLERVANEIILMSFMAVANEAVKKPSQIPDVQQAVEGLLATKLVEIRQAKNSATRMLKEWRELRERVVKGDNIKERLDREVSNVAKDVENLGTQIAQCIRAIELATEIEVKAGGDFNMFGSIIQGQRVTITGLLGGGSTSFVGGSA